MDLSNRTTRRVAALVGAAATAALLVPLAGAAQATPGPAPAVTAHVVAAAKATAPDFLGAADLPPAPGTSWTAGPVTAGMPEWTPFCLEGVLPAKGGATWHRAFNTDLDTWAVQVSVTAPSTGAARRLAAAGERAAAGCAADWLRATPGGTASWADYGRVAAGDGAHVYGVHTSVPDSEPGAHLIGVGRDGRTVTFVQWARMGDLTDAPVTAFKGTTAKAVHRLH
ncbi:hypothetical protein [Streptomyces sp. SS162]|uniref:hypothetical protein n=1 Tax=Streptomyces sp. SS162 TaxID=3108484 RepID=UPI002F4248EC